MRHYAVQILQEQTQSAGKSWKEDLFQTLIFTWNLMIDGLTEPNMINSDNEYEQTGYPLGLTVMSMAHSYGVSYAEDIMFVTVKVRNESVTMMVPSKEISLGKKNIF